MALDHKQMIGCESDISPKTERQARQVMCRSCDMGELKKDNACRARGPYAITVGYMNCQEAVMLVQPLQGGRLFLDTYSSDENDPLLRRVASGYLRDFGFVSGTGEPSGGFSGPHDEWFNEHAGHVNVKLTAQTAHIVGAGCNGTVQPVPPPHIKPSSIPAAPKPVGIPSPPSGRR